MKFALKSRTFWVNLVTLVTVLLALPELQAFLGENALEIIVVVQSVLNIVLRFLGGAPLTLKTGSTGDGQ